MPIPEGEPSPRAVPRWKMPVRAALSPASWTSSGREGPRAGSRVSNLTEEALSRELVGVGFEMLAQIPAIHRKCKEAMSLMLLQSFKRGAAYPGPRDSVVGLRG